MMAEARLVEGPNVFRDAVANGVLVKKGIQLKVDGKLRTFGAGDVIQPAAADVADGADFVQEVGNRCRSAGGKAHGSSWFGVFMDKKDLVSATTAFRKSIAEGQSGQAWRLVEAELTRLVAQGRKPNGPLIDRIVDQTLGSFDSSITDPIRRALHSDFETAKPDSAAAPK